MLLSHLVFFYLYFLIPDLQIFSKKLPFVDWCCFWLPTETDALSCSEGDINKRLVTWPQAESKNQGCFDVIVATYGVHWLLFVKPFCVKHVPRQIFSWRHEIKQYRKTIYRDWPLGVSPSWNSGFCTWRSAFTFDKCAVVSPSSPPQFITPLFRPLSSAQTWLKQVFCLRSSWLGLSVMSCSKGVTYGFIIATNADMAQGHVSDFFLIWHKQNT